jgi:hypothetical protein
VCRATVAVAASIVAMGCATAAPTVNAPSTQAARPNDIRIVSEPERESERQLAYGTWALAIGTAAVAAFTAGLCWITTRAAKKQSEDMQAYVAAAKQTATAAEASAAAAKKSADAATVSAEHATRQWRGALEREANVLAHRVSVTATRVKQLTVSVITAHRQLLIFAGRTSTEQELAPIKATAEERTKRADEIAAEALNLVGADLQTVTDTELAARLRRLDEHLVQLEAAKEVTSAELERTERDTISLREQRAQQAAQIAAAGGRVPPPIPGRGL